MRSESPEFPKGLEKNHQRSMGDPDRTGRGGKPCDSGWRERVNPSTGTDFLEAQEDRRNNMPL
jgi:hypothetical protein